MTLLLESPAPATRFTLPQGAAATAPPERRGLDRDGVRLLVARPGSLRHTVFRALPEALDAGDLLVINTSATLPAAVDGELRKGQVVPVHVSSLLDEGSWVVEVRRSDGTGPDRTLHAGATIVLPGDLTLSLIESYPHPRANAPRLWRTQPRRRVELLPYLADHGRPIEYAYLAKRYPLADHQTVYATQAGSAEMASAGRPFTAALITRLVGIGVTVAPLVLHTGVSSPEAHEPPLPEWFEVPEATARLVTSARDAGRRVIAVGTTVVRALESAAGAGEVVRATSGWTDLVVGPGRLPRVVSGLITGLHAPEASHLLLLEGLAGEELVAQAYAAAIERGYLWHEFGDSMLFLP